MQSCAHNLWHLAQTQSLMLVAFLLLFQGVLAVQAAPLPVSVPSEVELGHNPTSAEAFGKAAAGHTRGPETPDPALL